MEAQAPSLVRSINVPGLVDDLWLASKRYGFIAGLGIGAYLVAYVGVDRTWIDVVRAVIGTFSIAALVVPLIALAYLLARPQPTQQGDADLQPDPDRIVTRQRTRTSYSAVVRPDAPEYANAYRLWQLLTHMDRYEDVTLSEATARDYQVVSNRDDYRRLLRWLVDNELYVTANREDRYSNQQGGELTEWARELVAPTPNGDSANERDFSRDTDEPTDEQTGWGG